MDERYWTVDHPVLELLRARRERADRAGERRDPHRLGLAIQGGGMRGVVSGAMLTALEDLGLGSAFDAIYGTSSGAMNGAYFYGGELWRGLSVYWDHLTTKEFIDVRRFFTGGSVLDLDYAFHTVMERLVPFDADAVLQSKAPLHVAMTLVDELRSQTVSAFTSKQDLLSALRASSWLPVAVRGTAHFRGQRALDGFVLTVHPYHFALADGCTHVLSLSSRPVGPMPSASSIGLRLMGWQLDRIKPGLGAGHIEAVHEYRKERVELFNASASPAGPPYLLDLAPLRWMPQLEALERDPDRLILAARYAYELMDCALNRKELSELRNGRFHTASRFVRTRNGSIR